MEVFETGNAEIDALHRRLFGDCDRLMELVADGGGWPVLVAAARQLVADCIAHFRIEEALLARGRFPRCDSHVAEHRRIEQELKRLIARMEQLDGSNPEHRDLPASLGPALIDLMIRHDLDYRSHLLHQQGR